MKRILRHPALNAICITIFTAFYGSIFIVTSGQAGFRNLLFFTGGEQRADPFWEGWSGFLASGHQAYIAYALIAVTALIVVLLTLRRHSYDEYHTALLIECLAVATVLTLIAIAVFYLMILNDPSGIVEKFTLFIVIHWTTVVLADLSYVILCRWG